MPGQQSWRFEGTILDFIDLVQWVLVLRKLCEEGEESRFEILCHPELVRQEAADLGITKEALVREMLRIGRDAESMIGHIR